MEFVLTIEDKALAWVMANPGMAIDRALRMEESNPLRKAIFDAHFNLLREKLINAQSSTPETKIEV